MDKEFAPALVFIVMFLTMGGILVLRGPLGKSSPGGKLVGPEP